MRKYILTAFLTLFVFAFLPSMQAKAESRDGFILDGTGAVTLQSQHAADEKVSSLQFSLNVEPQGEAQVEFVFEPNNARIAEFRYNESTKKLNIYMAGVDPLFAENTQTLAVGKVVVRNGSGEDAAAKVSVVEDSLYYVYGEEAKLMEEVEIPQAVQLGSAVPTPEPGSPTSTPEPGSPTSTPDPGNPTPTPEPGSPTSTPDPGNPTPTPEPGSPTSTPDPGNPTPTPEPGNPTQAPSTEPPQDPGATDDPNAGWNPGWQEPEDNTPGGTPKPGGGSGRKPAGTGNTPGANQVASSKNPTSPSPSPQVSPSPAPEASETEGEEDDVAGLPVVDVEEEGEQASEPAMSGQENAGETKPAQKTNWVLVVVIIAIVIFVAVAAVSVIVLKGKESSRKGGSGEGKR